MNIYIMQLEPIESRYTCEWFDGLPKLLNEFKKSNHTIHALDGIELDHCEYPVAETTTGAFLNFTTTNIWKNIQMNALAFEFAVGSVQPGDKILFTDAWHSGIIQTKYMSELLDIPVEIHAIWHAGSYDPQDFLGRKIKDKRWSLNFEKSLYHAIDYNYFATDFHKTMFTMNVLSDRLWNYDDIIESSHKLIRSGQPHNVLVQQMQEEYDAWEKGGGVKRNLILFPHRIAPEKQPEIFKDLAESMPQYEWVMCQEQNLTKKEYHKLLFESKMVFSANLQETLGIGAMEAILANSIPFVPDRLSYSEMYVDHFKYPSEFTMDYQTHKQKLMNMITEKINNYDEYVKIRSIEIDNNVEHHSIMIGQREILEKYLHPKEMLDKLFE